MQSATFVFCDPNAEDFDPATSLQVAAEIYEMNPDFFDRFANEKVRVPGLRVARMTSPTDTVSFEDIRAWDRLVIDGLLPFFEESMKMLHLEICEVGKYDPVAYDGLMGQLTAKRDYVVRRHTAFMEAFERMAFLSRAKASAI